MRGILSRKFVGCRKSLALGLTARVSAFCLCAFLLSLTTSQALNAAAGGGEVPFPYGQERDLPMSQIAGVWMTRSSEGPAKVFHINFLPSSTDIVCQVKQVSEVEGAPALGQNAIKSSGALVIPSGDSPRVVHILMSPAFGSEEAKNPSQFYWLSIRAFAPESGEGPLRIVFSITPLGSNLDAGASVEAIRIK